MKTGIELIADERHRQIFQEGWTPDHDDQIRSGQLAVAAITYANAHVIRQNAKQADVSELMHDSMMHLWPWGTQSFKPTNSIRDLTKAGALIAAEIDRLQRLNA